LCGLRRDNLPLLFERSFLSYGLLQPGNGLTSRDPQL
jgi:hypothetical protein